MLDETQPRFDVTSFGKSMLRLSVPAGQRLEVASTLDVRPAGAESNVLSLLARLDRRCGWISGLPANRRAALIANQLAMAGVVAWDKVHFYSEPAVEVDVIDRIGAGDALAAGVIHGWLDGDLATGLRMGTVLAALALSQHGDMVVTNPEELRSLLTDPRPSVTR